MSKKSTSKNKYKTEWDLTLIYKSINDPKIEKDMKAVESACEAFAKKYKGKDFTSSVPKLLKALRDYEKVYDMLAGADTTRYFHFVESLESDNAKSGAKLTHNESRMAKAGNEIAFFELELGRVARKQQRVFLSEKKLEKYHYLLSRIFEGAGHNLSEGEEQLASLLSQPAYRMWTDAREKAVRKLEIQWKGKKLPMSEALETVRSLPLKEQKKLHDAIHTALRGVAPLAESELNAVVNYKKIMDERRGWARPDSQTIFGYQNDEKTVDALAEAVSTKGFKVSHRFYKLHAKLLGVKKLSVANRDAKIGEIKKKFSFSESIDFVRDIFSEVNPEYGSFVESLAEQGGFDVYPKQGKQGGAYCSSRYHSSIFVLLNHKDDIRGLDTIAHEAGHAIHSERTRIQPSIYENYSIAAAETASTFFENVSNDAIRGELSDEEKIIFLHATLKGEIATIQRQIAAFNFERELHARIRDVGKLTHAEMAGLMQKHLRSYLGPAFDVTEDDGYFFVYWPHIRNFFYVYSYAFGQLVSRVLFERWKADHSFAKQIDMFLSAGGSKQPEDIFRDIGIDVRKPEFFLEGLEAIERDVATLERLARKENLI